MNLDTKTGKISRLNQKNQKNSTLWNVTNTTLITIMIIIIIYAQINGYYARQKIEIVEICNGKPTNETQMLKLEKQGYFEKVEQNESKLKEITEDMTTGEMEEIIDKAK